MMDIQREREAFECEFKQTDYYIAHGDLSTLMLCDDQYALDDLQVSFEMWQAAKAQAIPAGFIVIPTVFPESKAQILAEQEVETMSKRIDDKFRGGLEYSDEKRAHLVRMNVGERRQIFRDFFKMLDDLEQLNDSH